jgi:hypothetical protein
MDYKDIAEIRIRARSFHYKEYNNRRVFLKSYPLHCGAENKTAIEEMVSTTKKRVIVTVFHWSAVKGGFCYRGEHELQNLYHGLYPCQLQCPYGPNSAEIPPFLPPLGNCQAGTQWWKFGALF